MSSWFGSLHFRLIAGFALVLALALMSVSLYVRYVTQQEVDRFQQELEDARAFGVQRFISQYYTENQDWAGLQKVLQQAGPLHAWEIVVRDSEGRVVGESHQRLGRLLKESSPRARFSRIASIGRDVGSVVMAPPSFDEPGPPDVGREPPPSRIVSALNKSLLWTGIAAGLSGILLVSLVSQRALASVGVLNSTARRLGRGDLSQRVPELSPNEIGELGRTFNAMADGLETAERQRLKLMADVAHELGTPLSNIQGFVEAIKDGVIEPDQAAMDTIHQQVLHLAHLVGDVKLLALMDAGDIRLNLEPDSLGDVLRRSTDAFRPRAEAEGVRLTLEIPDDLPPLAMDRVRIAQVVSNLLENAIRHTPEGGRVAVSVEMKGLETVEVAVADSGEGIPPEHLPFVFDRFYRVDPSRTRATGGAGLGLAIAKELIEAHGGTARAESAPGAGTRIVIGLPIAALDRNQRNRG